MRMSEIKRIIAAFGYSFAGLKAASSHAAFRTELVFFVIMAPLAFYVGDTAIERALLISSLLLVLIVELLNTGIEGAIDRISAERHPLSKFAKDVASAAVFLSLVNASVIWLLILVG